MSLIEIEGLGVELPFENGLRAVLRDVSLTVEPGEALAIVGESGSGKSMTLRSILRLLPPGAVVSGSVRAFGVDVATADQRTLRRLRAERLGVVFQDPRAHVNPVRRVGDFMTEALIRSGIASAEANRRAVEALEELAITRPAERLRQYPHELSGGMLQRVMIATALLSSPDVLLADEPTTALDVTTQSDIMAVIDELRRERGLAVVLVTHDIELAAAVSDRVAVMYAGSIVEVGRPQELLDAPHHPYTAALLGAQPDIAHRLERLVAIPGQPVAATEAPDGCPFRTRCMFAEPRCAVALPELKRHDGVLVRCIRADELAPTLAGMAS